MSLFAFALFLYYHMRQKLIKILKIKEKQRQMIIKNCVLSEWEIFFKITNKVVESRVSYRGRLAQIMKIYGIEACNKIQLSVRKITGQHLICFDSNRSRTSS